MAQTSSGGSLISKIGSYLQIISKDSHSTAFVPLAEAYRQVGLLDDALEAARLGTRSLPHFSPGFSTLGRVLGQMGRIDEAMSAFAKALSIDRQSQAALVGLARLHLIRGERDQARKILNEAADFHPADDHIQNMLVALDLPRPWDRLKVGKPEISQVATPPAPEAVPAAPVEPEASSAEVILTATLAEIYVKQGLPEKAVGVYEEILRRDPDNQSVRERLNALTAAETTGSQTSVSDVPPPLELKTPAPVPPQEAVPEPVIIRTPLEVLEGWLAGIRQRREHVH